MYLSGRERICALLPHGGAMCLIDDIVELGESRIVCRTMSHTEAGNPLRFQNRLPAVCALEYVGQATYLHGVLALAEALGAGLDPERLPLAFIAALRGVTMAVDRLDGSGGPLNIDVTCRSYSLDASSYAFVLESGGRELVSGRLTSKIVWGEIPA